MGARFSTTDIRFELDLPAWALGALNDLPTHLPNVDARMAAVIENNWRPCAMCLGATAWSGVRSLVVAGDGPELEAITGFDEGPAHPDWRRELERRGIDVIQDVLRDEALAAFREFAASRSEVYNARQGSRP